MVRLMKCEEALAILEHVKTHFPLDESTLQAMSVCYKELLLRELIFFHKHTNDIPLLLVSAYLLSIGF